MLRLNIWPVVASTGKTCEQTTTSVTFASMVRPHSVHEQLRPTHTYARQVVAIAESLGLECVTGTEIVLQGTSLASRLVHRLRQLLSNFEKGWGSSAVVFQQLGHIVGDRSQRTCYVSNQSVRFVELAAQSQVAQ